MSERMTVARREFEHFLWARMTAGRMESDEPYNKAAARADEAFDRLKQAILDEGLKEYQELLLGIEWQGASADEPSCPRCGGLMPSMTYVYADSAVSMYGVGHRPNCALDAALAAVRESQVSEGGV